MPDLVPVRRALISVSDKSGLTEFATALVKEFNVTLLSTGGTAKALRDAGLEVTDVSDVTQFPEMMDGRVKTLHPKIHGALLAVRDNAEHVAAMKEHGIEPIDLVVVNLYPFEFTVRRPDVTFDEAIENIDIGGPSMIRSAAKNHAGVAVVTSPASHNAFLEELRKHNGSTTAKYRLSLARHAFGMTANYDIGIHGHLTGVIDSKAAGPQKVSLRYGENPHQTAELYRGPRGSEASIAYAVQHHGKELSYINVLDADAALACVKEFDGPAACIVKHATPCGVGTGITDIEAVEIAYKCDPVAAFGGIVALNVPMTAGAAGVLTTGQKFLEVIVAPSFDAGALDILKTRWKNVRLLEVGEMYTADAVRRAHRENTPNPNGVEVPHVRSITGGSLLQQPDRAGVIDAEWKSVGPREPSAAELADLKLAWLACKHTKSNAVVIAHGAGTVGIGGGQVDRVTAAKTAVDKAGIRAVGGVAASDAFFPFADGPKLLIDAGVTAIVQPGGSVRDQETIDLCNERNVALIFTGRRHFKH